MSNKRARLDDNGRQVRELELELELARLRRQDDEVAREESSSGPGQAAPVQGTSAPPVSHPGTSAATPAAASAATPAPPTTAATTAPPTTAATTPAGPEPQARGRGRGGRGARGRSFSLDNRGLQTVFVCVACDKIYCQHCNAYEQARSYWARQ